MKLSKIIVFLILAIFLLIPPLFAANRYWVGGSGNWSDTNHWSNQSGGTAGKSVPGATDNASFDANSGGGTCTVNQNVDIKAFDMTGSVTTVDASNATLNLSGACTFVDAKFTENTSTVIFDGGAANYNGSTTFNNVTIDKDNNKALTIQSGTITVNGTLTLTDGMLDTGAIHAKGNISQGAGFDGGDATLTINGADQTLSGNASGTLPKVNINTSGTLTFSGTVRTTSDWTYAGGDYTTGETTMVFAGSDTNYNGSMTFNNVTIDKDHNASLTVQSGTITVEGTLTLTDGKLDTGTVNAEDDVTVGAGSDGGTATLELTVAGNQGITGSGGRVPDTLNLNKPSDTVTVSGDTTFENINLQQSTLTFSGGSTYTFDTSGTGVVTSNGTTINVGGSSGSLATYRRTGAGTWTFNVHAGGAYTANFVDVEDSNATGQLIYSTDSQGSDNTNWFLIDKIVFTTDAQTISVDQVSEAITVQLQNDDGSEVNVGEDITIDLTTTSGTGKFYSDAAGTSEITQVTIADGANSATFYYKDSTAGSPEITAAEDPSKNWDDDVQTETIQLGLDHFDVNVTSPQVAGTAFTVEVIARKSDGTIDTGYSGGANLTVNYVSPSTGTEVLEGATKIPNFQNGVRTRNVNYDDAGTITITATDDQGLGATGTSSNIVVRPDLFDVTPNDTTQEAGTSFTLTITAKNSKDETTPNYSGDVTLSASYVGPTTGTKSVSSSSITSASFTNGAASVTDVNYTDCGTITITATDSTYVTGVNITGTSNNIFFRPAKFQIDLSEIPASRTFYYIDEPFDITVTAQDVNGDITPNYRGTTSIANAANVGLSLTYTFQAADSGQHQFTDISGSSESTFTIGIADSSYSQASGESDTIEIKYGEVVVISTSGPVGTLEVDVRIRDSTGNIITSDDSTTFTVSFVESIDNDSATSGATTSNVTISRGRATIQITDNEAETVTVTPVSNPTLEPISGNVTFGTVAGGRIDFQYWKEER